MDDYPGRPRACVGNVSEPPVWVCLGVGTSVIRHFMVTVVHQLVFWAVNPEKRGQHSSVTPLYGAEYKETSDLPFKETLVGASPTSTTTSMPLWCNSSIRPSQGQDSGA